MGNNPKTVNELVGKIRRKNKRALGDIPVPNRYQLPPSVRIGFRTYAIIELTAEMREKGIDGDLEYDDNLSTSLGRISERLSQMHISFDGGLVDATNTLLHEIIHGICYHAGENHSKQCDSEYLSLMVSNGLSQVMHDNPDVFQWILDNSQSTNKIVFWTNDETIEKDGND